MTDQPRLASTVMLLRDADAGHGLEVFMVRRVVQSEFMPDTYVFPGGSVSADDARAEETAGLCVPVAPSQADPEGRTALGSGCRAAAIREMFEEANVLLAYDGETILAVGQDAIARFASYRQDFNARKGSLLALAANERLVLATDRLAYFAHWITPVGMPRRFDTHFFLAQAPAEQEAAYDHLETSDGVWIHPREALERFAGGEFPTTFPTFHQLRDLAEFASVQEALTTTITRYVPTNVPLLSQKDGQRTVFLPGDEANMWKV